ncbi:MAG: hypothetical protein JSS50_05290 [Proteobacteria bacterium]|nr:hypothetical protein [Pseudomonadota bacterium]
MKKNFQDAMQATYQPPEGQKAKSVRDAETTEKAYNQVQARIHSELGQSSNAGLMWNNDVPNYYATNSDAAKLKLIAGLSENYIMSLTNKSSSLLRSLHYVNQVEEGNTHLGIVKKGESGEYDKVKDTELNKKYATALGRLEASIGASIEKMFDSAKQAVIDMQKKVEYQHKLHKKSWNVPGITIGLYGSTVLTMVICSSLAHDAVVVLKQAQALVKTMPLDLLEGSMKQYWGWSSIDVDTCMYAIIDKPGFDFYWNPGLNDANRATILQIRELFTQYQNKIWAPALILTISSIAMLTLWTVLFADSTHKFVEDKRIKAIKAAWGEAKYDEQLLMPSVFQAPKLDIYLDSSKQVKVDELNTYMANTEISLNLKVSLMDQVLQHERSL